MQQQENQFRLEDLSQVHQWGSDEEYIQVRVLNHSNLHKKTNKTKSYSDHEYQSQQSQEQEQQQKQEYQSEQQYQQDRQKQKIGLLQKLKKIFEKDKSKSYKNTIIVHVHGGGFISMSSGSHQNYTRQWANNLKVPVFSIDYRLAPKHKFPACVDDSFQGLLYIIKNCEELYQIKPENVILTGDSAGGNLILVLMNLLIRLELKARTNIKGLYLIYGAVMINRKIFSPSLLKSLDDQILPYSFIKICLESYIDPIFDVDNFMMSPINTPDCILKQYPATTVNVGSDDPLYDCNIELAEKLNDLGVDTKLYIYKDMPHGYFCFDISNGVKEAHLMYLLYQIQELMILSNILEIYLDLISLASRSLVLSRWIDNHLMFIVLICQSSYQCLQLLQNMMIGLFKKQIQKQIQIIVQPQYLMNQSKGELQIMKKLKQRLETDKVQVQDTSSGGTNYQIIVESEQFRELTRVKQHQKVTSMLKEELEDIHAIEIQTIVPTKQL